MITYRNPLWNILIKFLKEVKDYSYFKDNFEGKYAKRVQGIYDNALLKLHINSGEWNKLLETFAFISEKDILDEMQETFEEAAKLGLECNTSEDGERIYKLANEMLKDRKTKEEHQEKLNEAKRLFEEKKRKHDEFLATQDKTLVEYEEAKKQLESLEKELKKGNKK